MDILLIDDETEFLSPLSKRLARRGIRSRTAHSGESGLSLFREQPVKVVVLDLRMKGMDGFQTLAQLHGLQPPPRVILLSGQACLATARRGIEAGAFDYLMKPVDLNDLISTITQAHETAEPATTHPRLGPPRR
ncbi:MAG: response regulator [Desulfobacterales bacterium]|nr:response regulator [Desulfobacterales bacterium]